MDFSVNIDRTYDINLIRNVVLRPEIWETIAEDGHSPYDYHPDLQRNCFLHVWEDEKTIGLFEFKPVNAVTIDVHPYILPEFRGKKANEAGKLHLEWVYDNLPHCNKIIGNIPTLYKNVKIYSLMLGYREEGYSTASYLKNGEIHDRWYLGITRDEIERQLQCQE